MILLSTEKKNAVLASMMKIIDRKRKEILNANAEDIASFDPCLPAGRASERAMYDRLIVDHKKVDGMIQAVNEIMQRPDPIGRIKSEFTHENGMRVVDKTAPFGTILIIYESRPDVTIEAAVVAFKSNNRILLKGGKEAARSNEVLVDCWHEALKENGLRQDWIKFLRFNRAEIQQFLQNPTETIDLIVPRGGKALISFVKQHARCPVLVSGRGNNFLYIHEDADWSKTLDIIVNAKVDKISACNALDKVLFHRNIPGLEKKLKEAASALNDHKVEILVDNEVHQTLSHLTLVEDEEVWSEEFLALKICFGVADSMDCAISKINRYSGGHSISIMTEDAKSAGSFMDQIDGAAVYHNASTRFTDGGQLGIGAELAISTDKLHHRGPLGLDQLVTNKWYIYGDGQVRS